MSDYYLHILCEGQSEGNFSKKHLSKYLQSFGIHCQYSLITTNKDKNKKGGNTDYAKLINEINELLKHPYCIVTTFVDYYRFPENFPSFQDCVRQKDKYKAKQCIENGMSKDINNNRFIPYVQLHEFEAIVFADIPNTKELEKKVLQEILNQFNDNPEYINSNKPPSKRIASLVKGYSNSKSLMNTIILESIVIDNVRQKCKGFNEWIENILNYFNKIRNT